MFISNTHIYYKFYNNGYLRSVYIMKKIKFAFLTLVVIIALSLVQDISFIYAKTSTDSTDNKQYVIDEADILDDREESKLQAYCAKASQGCETDIVIITLKKGLDYSDLDNYIRNIIYKSYRYDKNSSVPDAIVYAVDMKSRADRIITSGKAKDDITQVQLDSIRKSSEGRLSKEHYYSAFNKYIDNVQKYLNNNIIYKITRGLIIKLGISLVITMLAIWILTKRAKSRMTVNAQTYTKNHKVNVIGKEDRFINTTVKVTNLQSSSSGGGSHSGGGNSGSWGGHF